MKEVFLSSRLIYTQFQLSIICKFVFIYCQRVLDKFPVGDLRSFDLHNTHRCLVLADLVIYFADV